MEIFICGVIPPPPTSEKNGYFFHGLKLAFLAIWHFETLMLFPLEDQKLHRNI